MIRRGAGPSLVVVVALVALGALPGCASAIGVGRADTVAAGEVEVDGAIVAAVDLVKGPARQAPLPWAALQVGARAGVVDGVDVGARAWGGGVRGLVSGGAAVDGKLRIVRAPSDERGISGVVDVGLSYDVLDFGGSMTHIVGVGVPILFGFNTGGGNQFVIGPRFSSWLLTSASASPQSLGFVGGSMAYAIRIGDAYEVRPELVVEYSPTNWNGQKPLDERRGLTVVQLGVSGAWSPR